MFCRSMIFVTADAYLCCRRLAGHWFACGKSSHAAGSNDVSASAFEIEVGASLVAVDTKDIEMCIDMELVNKLGDFHSRIG